MNKRIHQVAGTIGAAAIGTIFLAGPALASMPAPDGGTHRIVAFTQGARVQSDLLDLKSQATAETSASPSSDPSPVDLPYLQIGLGAVVVAALAAGTTIRVRRHHGVQPV